MTHAVSEDEQGAALSPAPVAGTADVPLHSTAPASKVRTPVVGPAFVGDAARVLGTGPVLDTGPMVGAAPVGGLAPLVAMAGVWPPWLPCGAAAEHSLQAVRLDDPVLESVLCALAGARRGERLVCLGGSARLVQALLAGAGIGDLVDHDADVAVAAMAYELPSALLTLRRGGRMVAVAANAEAAGRMARDYRLELRHVELVGRRVAWTARRQQGGQLPEFGPDGAPVTSPADPDLPT